MQNENRIYAVDAQLLSGNESEAAVVNLCAECRTGEEQNHDLSAATSTSLGLRSSSASS